MDLVKLYSDTISLVLRRLLLIILLIAPLGVQACGCGSHLFASNSGIAGSIITVPAYTLEKNSFNLGVNFKYQNVNEFAAAKFAQLNASRIHAHSQSSIFQYSMQVAYGLSNDLTLSVELPFNNFYGLQSSFGAQTIDEGNSVGLGDLSLLTKYRFLNLKDSDIYGAVIAGIKMPTGHTGEINEFGFELAGDDQPGTGSWDPVIGLALSKRFYTWSLDSSLIYKLSTEGKGNLIAGDIVNWGLGASYYIQTKDAKGWQKLFPARLFGQDLAWALVGEINGTWQEKTEFEAIKDSNHGGAVISLSPGIRLSVNENWMINAATSIPIIQNLNGEQPELSPSLFFNINRLF